MVSTFTPTPAPEESQIILQLKQWFSLANLKSVLLRRHIIALIAGLIIFFIGLAMIAPPPQQQQAISPEMLHIQQIEHANYRVSELAKNMAVENFTINTAGMTPGSGIAEQMSDFQAAQSNMVIELRQEIDRQTTDPKSPHYQQHKSLAYQGHGVNNAKLALVAAEGGTAIIKFKDPQTGQIVDMEVRPSELQAIAMMRTQTAALAEGDAVARPANRMDIAKGLWAKMTEFQSAVANKLELQGYQDLAGELRSSDIFGRELVAPSLVPGAVPNPQSFNQPPQAPQIQQQSFAPKQQRQQNGNQQISLVIQAHPGY